MSIEKVFCEKCLDRVPADELVPVLARNGAKLCRACVIKHANITNPSPSPRTKRGRGYPPFKGKCGICRGSTSRAGMPVCDLCQRTHYGRIKHGRKSRGLKSCPVEKPSR